MLAAADCSDWRGMIAFDGRFIAAFGAFDTFTLLVSFAAIATITAIAAFVSFVAFFPGCVRCRIELP